MSDMKSVEYQDCYVRLISMDSSLDGDRLPRFVNCYFGSVEGRIAEEDLPVSKFIGCIFEEFVQSSATTASVLSLDLPLGVKVLVTILKKLYEQRGTGRRENALFRGLDHRSQRHVRPILRILEKHECAQKIIRGSDSIWLPLRSNMKRISRIIAAPSTVNDPLVVEIRNLD